MTRTVFSLKFLSDLHQKLYNVIKSTRVSLNLALRDTPLYPKEKSPKTFPAKVRGTRRCVRFQFALVMTMTTSHVGPKDTAKIYIST